MLASTDALAITAVLRHAGGPESLVTLLEGESLLNDASGDRARAGPPTHRVTGLEQGCAGEQLLD